MNCTANVAGVSDNGTVIDLTRRAQQGDGDAFASLFEKHKVRVYSLCLRMTNNAAEAEDLTQDAFLQVFRKLDTFRGDSALSTWLYRIAVNTVLMHFRRKSPRRISLDENCADHGSAKPVRREYGTRDGRLETSVTRIALARAISELPEGYRAIFLLHEVDGYQHREIAELLGCSVGTSKSQLHKAKLRIRDILTSGSQVQSAQVHSAQVQPLHVQPAQVQPAHLEPAATQPAVAILGSAASSQRGSGRWESLEASQFGASVDPPPDFLPSAA